MSKSRGVGKGFGGGPKKKFREDYIDQTYKLCLLGYTNVRLAKFFKVSIITFYRWAIAHPMLRKALLDGREVADANVAEGLYKRATGYEFEETVTSVREGTKITTKILHPDPNAVALWLKNRQRNLWADKVDIEVKHTQEYTDEELEAEIAKAKKKMDE